MGDVISDAEMKRVLELAEKATRGEWKQTGSKAHPHWNIAAPECLIHGIEMKRDGHIQETIDRWIADAAYMVAVQPAFVTRLITELLSLRKASHSVSQCCPESERLAKRVEELEADRPKTADGIPMVLGMAVYVVRALAELDNQGYGRGPLNTVDDIIEAQVAAIGMLGAPHRRAALLEPLSSFTISANLRGVFSTREAAAEASAKGVKS